VLIRRECRDHPYSLVRSLVRLGCTRIGTPGIFGEREPKALFKLARPQVARERKSVGYRASSCVRTSAHKETSTAHLRRAEGDDRAKHPVNKHDRHRPHRRP